MVIAAPNGKFVVTLGAVESAKLKFHKATVAEFLQSIKPL